MILDINYREKNSVKTQTWKLNNTLLNNQAIIEETKEEIKHTQKQMTMKTQWPKPYGMQQKQF